MQEPTEDPADPSTDSPEASAPSDQQSSTTETPTGASSDEPEFTKEELRLAMKAFRKRIKLMRLDDESSLGYGPMSSGSRSSIAAIRPPDQFPAALWRELANRGKLRREAGGLYAIVES